MERLFDCKNTIDDSVRVVSRDFMRKYRPELLKARKPVQHTDDQLDKIGQQIIKQAAAKVQKSKSNKGGELRKAAFDMYMAGAPAGDVAKTLCITYANAHYYKRAFKKEFG
jgi:hypothetical protein